MKREYNKTKKLPSFIIDLNKLEILYKRLNSLFDTEDSEKLNSSISIEIDTETLFFDDIEDINRNSHELPNKIENFSISVSKKWGKSVDIYSYGSPFFPFNYTVCATSDSEAWCAGAVETAYSFFNSNSRWYKFISSFIGWMILIIILSFFVLKHNEWYLKNCAEPLFYTLILFCFFYFFRGKLFPYGVLVIKEEDNFFRKYDKEIGLFVTVSCGIIGLIIKNL